MAIKKKISELPESTDFKGLWTIGVNALNKTVKVSLEYIQTKINSLISSTNTATTAANEAASKALASSTAADKSAQTADLATSNANKAIQAAQTATNNANTATTAANEAASDCREVIEEAQQTGSLNLVPTAMRLDFPKVITIGNLSELFVKAKLSPESVYQNVLFLGDNKALTITPDGRITAIEKGLSTIHIIPTANTALYKSIQIEVINPTLRMINTRTQLHLLGNGNLLLN